MRKARSPRFACCLVAGGGPLCSSPPAGSAEPRAEAASGRALYHPDPGHLWNRLHEALFVRVGPDGRAYGRDRLEPLLWYASKHLLEDRPRDRLLALLDEFLTGHGERLINDPLKRAVL